MTHAIPVDDEYAEELKRRWNGKTALVPWGERYPGSIDDIPFSKEEKEEIITRLKKLGYF